MKKISINFATYPKRAEHLERVVSALLPQCDILRVYLNEYTEVPKCLRNNKKIVYVIGGENLYASGKFYWAGTIKNEYYFTVDDDFIYPNDYTAKHIEAIEKHNAVVCLHGRVLRKNPKNVIDCHNIYDWFTDVPEDKLVNYCGTGTVAFDNSKLAVSLSIFGNPKMIDPYFSLTCKNHKIPIVCRSHNGKELQSIRYDEALWNINKHKQMIVQELFAEKPEPLQIHIVQNRPAFNAVKTYIENTFEIDNSIIVLGANLGFNIDSFKAANPEKKIIIYQLEQISQENIRWWSEEYKYILQNADEVWDYETANIEFLKTYGIKAKHVKLQYSESLKYKVKSKKKRYDLAFFGSLNAKRNVLIGLLQTKYKIKILTYQKPFYNAELIQELQDCKSVVNLHYYDASIQEQVRIFELLINNIKVISEKSKTNYYPGIVPEFTNPDDMFSVIDKALSDKSNVAQKFKEYSQHKQLKIGVAYNTFYGLEQIEKSIDSLHGVADYVCVVHEGKSVTGDPAPENAKIIIEHLLKIGKIDEVFYYSSCETDNQKRIIAKRNIGLKMCKENQCTHIMPLDCDERYNSFELKNDIAKMVSGNYETMYSPIRSFVFNDYYYFEDTYFVPTIYRIDNRKFEKSESSVLCDPVRKMKEGKYFVSKSPMLHYSYILADYEVKIKQGIMAKNNTQVQNEREKTYQSLLNFNGKTAYVQLNDMNNRGRNYFTLVNLTKLCQ